MESLIPHELYDAAVPLGTIAVSWIGLKIRAAILTSKEELGVQINAIGGKIDVHVAEDRVIHDSSDKRIYNVEKDIDKLELAIDKLKG